MGLFVTLGFPDSGGANPIPGIVVHRYQLRDAMAELFELTLQIASTEPALDLHTVVGETVVVHFDDDPVQPEIRGLVRGVRQLSSGATSGAQVSASSYEIDVVPPLWLTTRRRDHRIFEDKTVVEIVRKILGGYDHRIPDLVESLRATPRKREYVVQYGETDFDFLARILADEGITWFFDHQAGGALTLVDDTTTQTRDPAAETPFLAQTDLITPPPHVFNVTVAAHLETSAAEVRDHDYEKANNPLEARRPEPGPGAGAPFHDEPRLEAYVFEVGKFTTQGDGDARAARLLDALRARARTFTMEASFTQGPGQRLRLGGHPRGDCNGSFLVVRARVIEDDGAAPAGDPVTNQHLLECIPVAAPFLPAPWPKPRIHASQTAVVVGGDDGDIVSDKLGRVQVQFKWDRGRTASRWVRVSQAWAGNQFGFFALPRVGDEVVISYLDGDPDEPLVVGRVHNSARRTTVDPTGKDKTVSTWKSQSLHKPSGFNEVLMDDARDLERLELHAERDYKRTVLHDAVLLVKHDEWLTVEHNKTDVIKRAYSMSAGSVTIGTGPYTLHARDIKELAQETFHMEAGNWIEEKAPLVQILGSSSVHVSGGSVTVSGDPIVLQSGGSKITLTPAGIDIKSDGPINLNGAPINLNC